MRIIIVAGSKHHTFYQYQKQNNDFYIGIEDGAYEIIKHGYKLDVAIGDFDTTTHYDEICAKASNLIKYPKEKDEIDLELALMYILKNDPDQEIYIYNATQGRIDHELITIKLLVKYSNLNIHLINDSEEVIYLTNDYTISTPNIRFSLIPFSNCSLEISGAKYNLSKTDLSIVDNFTSSNQTLSEGAVIKIYNGGIILIKEV